MKTAAYENAPRSTKKKSQDELSARILELQEKIRDEEYLDGAIARIAFVMSKQLIEGIPARRIF
jgi:hypothetical protein